ncbi:hypothetical protein PG_0431 [Porphyromonas gingivalis W83]|uniref:Uncharacterized protein n=1 Tax=Porphyromonas gingivalis (strain ATCC BAA-308 / W83) TaxID=242619 RepID=Q7MWZ7_PORGI|nr:hypothetical protein PG_0431 [Porphyromonas gingivalis W83]
MGDQIKQFRRLVPKRVGFDRNLSGRMSFPTRFSFMGRV